MYCFGKVVNPDTFIINGNVVRPEEMVKLLGVHIDNKLNFGHHVSHICQKAGKQVKVLGRLSRVLNESNKLLLYSSFISCYFNYCCILCMGMFKFYLESMSLYSSLR